MLLYPREASTSAVDRRKVSIIDIAKITGVILSDGELWDGNDRRGTGKRAKKKGEKSDQSTCDEVPCTFFG